MHVTFYLISTEDAEKHGMHSNIGSCDLMCCTRQSELVPSVCMEQYNILEVIDSNLKDTFLVCLVASDLVLFLLWY